MFTQVAQVVCAIGGGGGRGWGLLRTKFDQILREYQKEGPPTLTNLNSFEPNPITMPIHIQLTATFTPEYFQYHPEILNSIQQACFQTSIQLHYSEFQSNSCMLFLSFSEHQLIHSASQYMLHISQKLIFSKQLIPQILFLFNQPPVIESISTNELQQILNNSSDQQFPLAS